MKIFDEKRNVWYNNYSLDIANKQEVVIWKRFLFYRFISILCLVFPVLNILFWIWFINATPIPDGGEGGYCIGMIAFFILSFLPFGFVGDIKNKYYRIYHFIDFSKEFEHYYYKKN